MNRERVLGGLASAVVALLEACGARTGLDLPDVPAPDDAGCAAGPVVAYAQGFDDPARATPEWSLAHTETTPAGGQRYLGAFIAEQPTLTLRGLPCHHEVSVVFDLYVLDSWDGNQVRNAVGDFTVGPCAWGVRADGATVFVTTFSNMDAFPFMGATYTYRQAYPGAFPGGDYPPGTGAAARNSLGYSFMGVPMDATYHLTVRFAHTSATLALVFGRTVLDGTLDDPWGIDSVRVELR